MQQAFAARLSGPPSLPDPGEWCRNTPTGTGLKARGLETNKLSLVLVRPVTGVCQGPELPPALGRNQELRFQSEHAPDIVGVGGRGGDDGDGGEFGGDATCPCCSKVDTGRAARAQMPPELEHRRIMRRHCFA